MPSLQSPIGVFDSGYGGLSVLKELREKLPQKDFLYLGDNARSPYGTRSFETIYKYTLQAVKNLFDMGCPLVILACNTASARALRSIQQRDLPLLAPERRVLGILRPSTESLGNFSSKGHVGILGTRGTVESGSYLLELQNFFPELVVQQQVCPMWVPLVENHEIDGEGCRYFVKKDLETLLQRDSEIDTLLLACTHYPLLLPLIEELLPSGVRAISQGGIVAASLADYLQRHSVMEQKISAEGGLEFFTTDSTELFDERGSFFFGSEISSEQFFLS